MRGLEAGTMTGRERVERVTEVTEGSRRGPTCWPGQGLGGHTWACTTRGCQAHDTLEPLFVSGSKLSSTGVGCVLQAGLPGYCEMQVTPVERVPGRVSVVFTGVQRRYMLYL